MSDLHVDNLTKAELINGIIKEREVEHTLEAREKRHADLRRIQDMKSKTGLNPLQLFPKEIWMMILDELRSEDKRNAREVHETFCDLTDDKLVGDILLPMVMGFKVERFWKGGHFGQTHQRPCSLAQYAELRLVSKSLRNAIDRWYEDNLVSTLRNGGKDARPPEVCRINLLNPQNQKYSEMMADLSNSNAPKPPRFFSRSLCFVSSELRMFLYGRNIPQEVMELPKKIDAFLDHFGDQIWYFSYEFHCPFGRAQMSSPLESRYATLLGWLSKMPNLKWFHLEIEQRVMDSKNFKIPEGLAPPTLRHLERIDFVCMKYQKPNRYLMPIFNAFLSAYPHIKILNLVGFDHQMDELKGSVVLDFLRTPLSLEVLMIESPSQPPLRYMRYGCFEDWLVDDPRDDEESKKLCQFFAISSTNSPLRRIELQLKSNNPSSLFQTLSNFPTLETVVLFIDDVQIQSEEEIPFLKLPKLTHFELSIKMRGDSNFDWDNGNWSFFSLQFLLFAKKLNTLIWKCDMEKRAWENLERDISHNRKVGEEIDFAAGIWDIGKDSNLWQIFPRLQSIKVDRVIDDGEEKQSLLKEYRK